MMLNTKMKSKWHAGFWACLLMALMTVQTAGAAMVAQRPDGKRGGHPVMVKDKSDKCASKKFNPEKFKKELVRHITHEAGLTPKEAKAFFPVFFEMKEKQRALQRQKGRALRQAAKNNLNEKDCRRVLDEVQRLEKKSLSIEQEYVERLRKCVGAQKLLKAKVADMGFGRKMFHQMTKKR